MWDITWVFHRMGEGNHSICGIKEATPNPRPGLIFIGIPLGHWPHEIYKQVTLHGVAQFHIEY